MSAPSTAIKNAVTSGLEFLLRKQRTNGEFPTFWSRSRNMVSPTYADSPFITGMILQALTQFGEQVSTIQRKGLDYLRSKRRLDGSFAFLDTGIDSDLDDTCLLNWLLQSSDPDQKFYRILAEKIARLPIESGLYQTWLREDPTMKNDIDPCVNINVVRFLEGNGIANDLTIQSIVKILRRGDHVQGTLYYESGFMLPYLFFTLDVNIHYRMLDLDRENCLAWMCIPNLQREKKELSPIDAALKLFVMLNCKVSPSSCSSIVELLLRRQDKQGGWPAWGTFRAYNYWGSKELTTAMSVQALLCFLQSLE